MKIFHCNIYGNIPVSELALPFIDTSELQRLHNIKQTGGCYKVFPTAQHSRFEHSIGVYHLSGVWFDHLVVPESMTMFRDVGPASVECQDGKTYRELIKIAGLLHDIGHGPFSHTFDHFFAKKVLDENDPWKIHESRSIDIFRYMIKKYDIDFKDSEIDFVINCIKPTKNKKFWMNQIVCNDVCGIDADKLDYIFRDNKAFGLPLNIDVMRIIRNTNVHENQICFSNKIKEDLFDLFYVRYRLYKDIYCHPKVVAFESVISELLTWIEKQPVRMDYENPIHIFVNDTENNTEKKNDVRMDVGEKNGKRIENFCKLTDQYILNFPYFTSDKEGHEISDRFNTRKVYKLCDENDDRKFKTICLKVGFNGDKINPFEGIILFNGKTKKIQDYELNHIDIKCFEKKLTYHFRR